VEHKAEIGLSLGAFLGVGL